MVLAEQYRPEAEPNTRGIQFLRYLPGVNGVPGRILKTRAFLPQYGLDQGNPLKDAELIHNKYGPKRVFEALPETPHIAADLGLQLVQQTQQKPDIIIVVSSHLPQRTDDPNSQRLAVQTRETLLAYGLVDDVKPTPENSLTVSAACAGSVVAFDELRQMNPPEGANILSIADETGYRRTLPEIPADSQKTRLLFSDVGVAMQFLYKKGLTVLHSAVFSAGDPNNLLQMTTPAYDENDPFLTVIRPPFAERFTMQGAELMRYFSAKITRERLEAFLADAGLTPHDLSFFLGHQASSRMVKYFNEMFGSVPYKGEGIYKYGNTSSVSTLIDLYDGIRNGYIQEGDVGLELAYGGGLTWAVAAIQYV